MILIANLSFINHCCPFLKSRDCILGLSTGPDTQAVASILMKWGNSELMTESTPLPILAYLLGMWPIEWRNSQAPQITLTGLPWSP